MDATYASVTAAMADVTNTTSMMTSSSSLFLSSNLSTTEAILETTEASKNGSAGELSAASKILLTTVVPIILSTVCVVGLIGNFLVLYVMNQKATTRVQQRSITDIYVINLAVTDFMFLLMMPFWIVDFIMSRRWIFGVVLCKLISISTLMHMYAGVLMITVMAIDRVMAVVFYLSCRSFRTKRKAKITVFIIWLLSITFSLTAMNVDVVTMADDTQTCTWGFNTSHPIFFVQQYLRIIPGFLLPLAINSSCSITIALYLKNKKALGKLANRRQKKATKVVLFIVVFFIVCWLPNQISHFIFFLKGYKVIVLDEETHEIMYVFHLCSLCLLYSQSCVNPLLYALIREDLKVKMVAIFRVVTRLFSRNESCCVSLPSTFTSPRIMENRHEEIIYMKPSPQCLTSRDTARVFTQTSSPDFCRNANTMFTEGVVHTYVHQRSFENTAVLTNGDISPKSIQ